MQVHFIAIGGSAMHNLAIALSKKGYLITGSDDVIFEPSKSRLAAKGLLPESFGWDAARIHTELDAVVLGMHAKEDNPELAKALELGIKVYSYPEYLYEQSKNKTRVVIGGSHGKTTITAMILHVLNYHDITVDYMVGAQLDGFDTMVHLTEENEFMVLEGDEYLASPIDRRPKFHLYQPNIALLTGIAWDHINVFPTFENYVDQFKIFVDSIVRGGSITYNEEDTILKEIVEASENQIRKFPYTTAEATIENGKTYLETDEGPLPIAVFGAHNLNNLSGAKWICQNMGVDEADFYEAITSFKGASKRLENLAESEDAVLFKDFAHAPSKVTATVAAVKKQFKNRKVIACLELHTYSSLNEDFIDQYRNSLDPADISVVFYSPAALKVKGMPPISAERIASAFKNDDLYIFTDPILFKEFLDEQTLANSALLLMSSGNYGGLDLEELKKRINPS